MVGSMTVGALFDAWAAMDWAVTEVSQHDLLEQWDGGSAFAWTYGHVASTLDAWLNVRFQGLAAHPVIGDRNLGFGGSGRVADWSAIQRGVAEVRATTRRYLEGKREHDLDHIIPYDGSYLAARETGLSIRFALLLQTTHHHYHIGEILAKRNRLGHRVGEFPQIGFAMLAALNDGG